MEREIIIHLHAPAGVILTDTVAYRYPSFFFSIWYNITCLLEPRSCLGGLAALKAGCSHAPRRQLHAPLLPCLLPSLAHAVGDAELPPLFGTSMHLFTSLLPLLTYVIPNGSLAAVFQVKVQ